METSQTSQPATIGLQRKGSSPTGAIVGGVVGGVAGLLLILLGSWWLRRRRKLAADDDASVVDDTARAHEPASDFKGDPPVLAPVLRNDLSFSTTSLSDQATTVNAVSASSHIGPISEQKPKTTPGPSIPSTTSPHSGGPHSGDSPPSSPLVQYAEDAEDAAPRRREPLILPPRYKEAWGRPRVLPESEDGTGVFRADDGGSKAEP